RWRRRWRRRWFRLRRQWAVGQWAAAAAAVILAGAVVGAVGLGGRRDRATSAPPNRPRPVAGPTRTARVVSQTPAPPAAPPALILSADAQRIVVAAHAPATITLVASGPC